MYIRGSVRSRVGENPLWARIAWTDYDYALRFPVPKKGSKGQGIRFEKKVNQKLVEEYPGYVPSLPLAFAVSGSGKKMAIPDGVLVTEKEIVVVEIKLRHCAEAWHQLRRLYFPLIEAATGRSPRLLEICQNYTPGLDFPEPFVVTTGLEQFLATEARLGVWLWGK